MAEPFKNMFNAGGIGTMAQVLTQVDGFDHTRFLDVALGGIDDLELMQRADQIADAMTGSLPLQFPALLHQLTGLLGAESPDDTESPPPNPDTAGLTGWALVSVGKFVAIHGLDHPGDSLNFLREMTKRFSAEFAVRPFYRDHPDLTLAVTADWARDANLHVRRLASEGSRPRLPWGLRLARFVQDPTPLLPILAGLRDDPSEYVRRSVANNLNDIAKDHPDLVAEIAADWMQDASPSRQRLVKHACRSLIKSGHPATLAVFGYGAPQGLSATVSASPEVITLGDSLTLTATLTQTGTAPQPVLVDLIARFLRADGSHGAKVFKWTETVLLPGKPLKLTKRLPLKNVTTRRHYAGPQYAALQVNGQVVAETGFDLRLAD